MTFSKTMTMENLVCDIYKNCVVISVKKYSLHLKISLSGSRNWVICRDVDGPRDCHTE